MALCGVVLGTIKKKLMWWCVPDKPLLMLQSLKRAWRLDSGNPHLHDCLLRCLRWLAEAKPSLHPDVTAVISAEMKSVSAYLTLERYPET